MWCHRSSCMPSFQGFHDKLGSTFSLGAFASWEEQPSFIGWKTSLDLTSRCKPPFSSRLRKLKGFEYWAPMAREDRPGPRCSRDGTRTNGPHPPAYTTSAS